MAKGLNKFIVSKTFEVWIDVAIQTDTLENAVAIGKKIQFADLFDEKKDVVVNDTTELRRFGVREEW